MGFSQKALPALKVIVSESLVIMLPLSLPLPPSLHVGCSPGEEWGGAVHPWWSGGRWLCSVQGKAEEQQKPLWWCVMNPPACPVPCCSASPALLPGI